MLNKSAKLLLFLSSYIPLFIIILVQFLQKLINTYLISESECSIKFNNDFYNLIFNRYSLIIFVIVCLCIISIFLLRHLIKQINKTNPNTFPINVIKEENNLNVLNYFTMYIFPFITLDLTSISGFLSFIILFSLLGYVYIKNELLYVNPVLNIYFKYNIYSIQEGLLLSKKGKDELLNSNINIYKISEHIFLEKD